MRIINRNSFKFLWLAMPGRSLNSGTPNDLNKFTGHERDQEGGLDLDYMLARNYDSEIGRFLSVDPLASKSFAESVISSTTKGFSSVPNTAGKWFSNQAGTFIQKYEMNLIKAGPQSLGSTVGALISTLIE